MRKRRRWIGWHFDGVKRAEEAGNAEDKPPRCLPSRRDLLVSISSGRRALGSRCNRAAESPPFIVGRGPVPRHRYCTRPCSSGSPDPELFVIRRSQTTDGETHIVTMEIAGDRPPRYDKKRLLGPKGPKTLPLADGQRGGQAPALREHRDREVSPTGKPSSPEGSPTGTSIASSPEGSPTERIEI